MTATPKRNDRGRKIKAVFFLLRADESRYEQLFEDMRKADFVGRDEYPEIVNEVYELFVFNSRQFSVIIMRRERCNFGK